MSEGDIKTSGKTYVWGYEARIGPDGKAKVRTFGTLPEGAEVPLKLTGPNDSKIVEPFAEVIKEIEKEMESIVIQIKNSQVPNLKPKQ